MEKKQKKSKNKKPLFFRILYSIVKVFVKKYQFVFLEELKNFEWQGLREIREEREKKWEEKEWKEGRFRL